MLPSTFKYHKQVVVKNFSQKSNKRSMVGIITRETKREGQRKAKGCIVHRIQKKGRELVLLVVGKLFHP
jgi:hypothetical protein